MKLHEIGLPSISGSTHHRSKGGLPSVGMGAGGGGPELEKEPSFSEKDHVPLGIRGGHIDVEALGTSDDQALPPIGHRHYGFYGNKGQKTLRNTLHNDMMGGARMQQAGASTSSGANSGSSNSNKMKAFSRNLHMRFPSNVSSMSSSHATGNSSKRNSKYVSPYSQRFIASQAQSSNSGR